MVYAARYGSPNARCSPRPPESQVVMLPVACFLHIADSENRNEEQVDIIKK